METVKQAVEEVGQALAYQSVAVAERIADSALQQFPESGDCWSMVALTKLWRGKLEEAESAIEKAAKVQPDGILAKVIAGEIQCYLGEKEEGIRLIDEGRQALPDHWVVLRQANTYSLLGRPEVSEQMLQRWLELAPENPLALSARAVQFTLTHDLEGMQAFLDSTPASYKSTCGFHRHSASLAIQRRDTVAAEGHLRAAVAADPESSLAWSVLASLLASTNRLDEAERAAGYSLEVNSRTPVAYRALATVARKRGDTAKVAEYERLAQEAVPGARGNSEYRKATEASRQGDMQERIRLLSSEADDNLPLHKSMRLRALAETLRNAKEFDKLPAVIVDLEAMGDDTQEYFGAKAGLLAHQGETERALETIEAGLVKLGNPITLLADKFVILHGLGRNEEAASIAKVLADSPVSSSGNAAHAITRLIDAEYIEEAKTLLTRAERETPDKSLKMIRFVLDLRERPEAAKLLADKIREKQQQQQKSGLLGSLAAKFLKDDKPND